MDYDQLYTFITIIQTKNYSVAAKLLNITQPTVTARIKQLEIELDCKLFNREGKTISLSTNGEMFSQFATKTLAYMDESKSAIRMSKEPGLKLGFSPGFSLSAIANIVNILKEQLHLSILLLEIEDSIRLSEQAVNEKLDLVIVLNPVIHSNQLAVEYLFDEKLVFITGQGHRLSNKNIIIPEDINGETMICYRRKTPLSIDVEEKLWGIKNLQRIEVSSIDMLKTMVKKGWGVSIISEMGVDDIEDGIIIIKRLKEIETIPNKVYALYRKDSLKVDIIKSILPLVVQDHLSKRTKNKILK